ncbi:MAG TPA: SprT family zinc-dependent metalloprotease [Coxiellaceae bacterium]|nr:SprT family zinc-dependent metalloprotease [Coxiellaceae bacterium]
MTADFSWPPPYSIRRSARARQIKLQITPIRGLEIVLPKRANLTWALQFLEDRRAWIEKHLPPILYHHQQIALVKHQRPMTLLLRARDECWTIVYNEKAQQGIRFKIQDEKLHITGNTSEITLLYVALVRWIKRQAGVFLTTELDAVSRACQLPYRSVHIRGQKTRWGSCSRDKRINLNYSLMFFPYRLMRYVLIHELCHTVHMDHSSRFWALVGQYEPEYPSLRQALRKAGEYLPVWLRKLE